MAAEDGSESPGPGETKKGKSKTPRKAKENLLKQSASRLFLDVNISIYSRMCNLS